ncbi:MAG: recombination mediator RecR [Bacilli bacterium]|nr:recombination mediator RecR [Bacilli bacterium]
MDKLKSLTRVEENFAKLPSVGKKSAERMAYALLDLPKEEVEEFYNSIKEMKDKIHMCPKCGFLSESDVCPICGDPSRDQNTLVIVSYPKDVLVFENSKSYDGLYHVLNGVISISKGKTVDDLNIDSLIERLQEHHFNEVILATNPTIEGETTALYLAKVIAPYVENITRLAYGLQMGGNLDYTDSLTLSKAIEGRRKI